MQKQTVTESALIRRINRRLAKLRVRKATEDTSMFGSYYIVQERPKSDLLVDSHTNLKRIARRLGCLRDSEVVEGE